MLKKKYDIKDLLKLLRARKQLIAKYQTDTSNVGKIFNNLSIKCDKVSIKMMAILLNKMFPKDPELLTYTKFNAKTTFRKRSSNEVSKSI